MIIFVIFPVKNGFPFARTSGFTPSVVTTCFFRALGTHVAARPFRAGGQTEVYHVGVVVVRAERRRFSRYCYWISIENCRA